MAVQFLPVPASYFVEWLPRTSVTTKSASMTMAALGMVPALGNTWSTHDGYLAVSLNAPAPAAQQVPGLSHEFGQSVGGGVST